MNGRGLCIFQVWLYPGMLLYKPYDNSQEVLLKPANCHHFDNALPNSA